MVAIVEPHAHGRDGKQYKKDTVARVTYHAGRKGVGLVMFMPNTDPALTGVYSVGDYLELMRETRVNGVSCGLHVGLTSNPAQIREAVGCYNEMHLRDDGRVGVVGLKMFAGNSTGNMGIVDEDAQRRVYSELAKCGYEGVLVIHAEKEGLMRPELWTPDTPWSHSLARPAIAESKSVDGQIMAAHDASFRGTLHFAHVSTPEAADLIDKARGNYGFSDVRSMKITYSVTPQHAFVNTDMMVGMNCRGLTLKVNPPVRDRRRQEAVLDRLKKGRFDWIETDHANHMLPEKFGRTFDNEGRPIYMSGIPGVHLWDKIVERLKKEKLNEVQIDMLTWKNALGIYGLPESVVGDANVAEDLSVKGYEYGYGDLI